MSPERKRVSTQKRNTFGALEPKPMVVVQSSTALRDAIKMAHREHEASFAVENDGNVCVIEALEIFEQIRRKFDGDAKRQLRAIRALCSSELPVLQAFKEAGINPIRIAGSGTEMQSVLIGERFTIAPPVDRKFGLDRSDPALFRIDRPIANAFSCVWVCESGMHLWPCALGTPPDTCENGKPWSQGGA